MGDTFTRYPFISQFGFNPWGMVFGFGDDDAGWSLLGTVLAVAGIVASLWLLRRRRDLVGLLGVSVLIGLVIYFLPTRVHERYLFGAIAFLAPLAAMERRLLWPFMALSAAAFLTVAYVAVTSPYRIFPGPEWADFPGWAISLMSAATTAVGAWTAYRVLGLFRSPAPLRATHSRRRLRGRSRVGWGRQRLIGGTPDDHRLQGHDGLPRRDRLRRRHGRGPHRRRRRTSIDGFVERMAERVGGKASVRAVFGDPIERDGITVIPVAKVRWGFGGGAGRGPIAMGPGIEGQAAPEVSMSEDAGRSGAGTGGGGGVTADPIGYLEIGPDGANFRPITPVMPSPGFLLAAGVTAMLVLRWPGPAHSPLGACRAGPPRQVPARGDTPRRGRPGAFRGASRRCAARPRHRPGSARPRRDRACRRASSRPC